MAGHPTSIIARLRGTRRAAVILLAVARHGFADVLQRTGLAGLVEGGLERIGVGTEHESISTAVRLRRLFEDLGTTFVKLGQILATRPDLIPPDVAAELRKLQSDAPRVPFEELRVRLEESFPEGWEQIFRWIDPAPLAAASIAQVHRGVLADGTPVVVKMLRPGVEELVHDDIAVLRDLARLLAAGGGELGFDPLHVAEEVARQVLRELDLELEGRSTERLRRDFEDDPGITFPRVWQRATTHSVLTMEEATGVQISKLEAGQLSAEERRAACSNGTRAVFRMCLEHGFFHADPHPGNIFIQPGGTVCFIDCGMTGHIDSRTRLQLGKLVRYVVDADLDGTLRTVVDLANGDPVLEFDRAFRSDVWEMITRFESGSLEELDIGALLEHFFEVLRRHHIRCPADLVYLIKALSTIESVAEEVDPAFDVMSEARVLLRRLFAEQYGFAALKRRFTRSLGGYAELVEELPEELRKILVHFRRREFALRVQHDGLDELRAAVLGAGRFMSMALILAATLVASSILLHGRGAGGVDFFSVLGAVALLVSILFALGMAWGVWRHK